MRLSLRMHFRNARLEGLRLRRAYADFNGEERNKNAGDIPCSDSQWVPSSRYLQGSAHIRRTPGREGCRQAHRENSVRTRQGGRVLVKPGGLPSQSLDDASLFITRDNAHLHLRLPQCEAYPWPKVWVGRPYPLPSPR